MQDNSNKGNIPAICIMFALFFMIAFVTNIAGFMGPVVKSQFGASNTASQLGSAANFAAYLFMGIPGGLILKRKGYKFTSLLAVGIGLAGLGVQLASGFVESFAVYVAGAFVAGFSMCLLNLVVNPMLNTLGGEGKKGNQMVQFGCTLNSVGATLAPYFVGMLVSDIAKAKVIDIAPVLYTAIGIFAAAFAVIAFSMIPEPHKETEADRKARISSGASVFKDIVETVKFRHFTLGAIGIFFYIIIECGIPNMASLYMTETGKAWAVDGAVAGKVVGAYWFCMMVGRLVGGVIAGRISSRAMITCCSVAAIALLGTAMSVSPEMVTVLGQTFPLPMVFVVLCGLCTSVMWGGIFNMAAEGLGKYVPTGSGIFMAMVCGGFCLPLQGMLANSVGILNSYWMTIGLLAYVLFYALVGSRVTKRAE